MDVAPVSGFLRWYSNFIRQHVQGCGVGRECVDRVQVFQEGHPYHPVLARGSTDVQTVRFVYRMSTFGPHDVRSAVLKKRRLSAYKQPKTYLNNIVVVVASVEISLESVLRLFICPFNLKIRAVLIIIQSNYTTLIAPRVLQTINQNFLREYFL